MTLPRNTIAATAGPLLGLALLAPGCLRVDSAVKVEPIHITMDINVKVDKALDSFFADLDQEAKTMPAATPAPTPTEVKP